MRKIPSILCVVASLMFPHTTLATSPQADDPKNTTWDLSDLYADEQAWKTAYATFFDKAPQLKGCKGKLARSAKTLTQCLNTYFQMRLSLARIASWASLERAGDIRSSKNSERSQLTSDLASQFRREIAFLVPEISKLSRKKIDAFLKQEKSLSVYRQYLREIADQAVHILDPEHEELLASLSPVLRTGTGLQSLLLSADLPWPTLALTHGKEKIDVANYTRLRESANRDEREKVFSSFFASLTQYQRLMGANLTNTIRTNVITARLRRYQSALHAALDNEKIPEEVYHTLIKQVNEGLPVFHRYLRYQAETLGLKKFEYHDAYVAGGDLDLKFPIADAKRIALAAVQPLGADYQQKLSSAFTARWMDIYPREGKANGAFMDGAAYEVHPFVLLNHQDNFSSVSTLVHEWGHALHTVYANESQPYVNARYSIFIAEIASTLNEILLHEKLISEAKTPKEKRFYLEALLKMIRATFFRQTQFAEFELELHQEIEKGGALSGQKISAKFGNIARKYYGHDREIMLIDEKYFSEWAFVPHFYNGFYVYQYATSLAAAFYFAEKILAAEETARETARENYLRVLRAGGSKYPYEILKDAGVDMKDTKVYQAVIRRAEKALNDLAAIQ